MDPKFLQRKPQRKMVICNQGFLYSIRIPREESYRAPVALSIPEHERIIADARGPNAIEKELEVIKKASLEKKEVLKAAEVRKLQIIEKDQCAIKQEEEFRRKSEKEAYYQYQRLREKAQLAQDIQIKELDRWILNSKIQAERDKQLEWKKHCEEIEVEREKAEFDRVLECTKRALAQEEEVKKNRLEDGQRHLRFIMKQVREREEEALAKRWERLTEAQRMKEGSRDIETWMAELKEDRIKDMDTCDLPEQYRNYVKKKTADNGVRINDSQYRTYRTYDVLPRWVTDTTRAIKAKSENCDETDFFLM